MRVFIMAAIATLAACNGDAQMAGRRYEPLSTAPKDGSIIHICHKDPLYGGPCELMYWGLDSFEARIGGKSRWLYVGRAGSGLMDENDRMANGERVGDLFKWRSVPVWEIEQRIGEHELALEQLRAFLPKAPPSE